MIGVEIPLGIDQLGRFITVGADTGVDFTALGQAHGAQIRFGADLQRDACRLKDLAQHVPTEAVPIGGGVVFPFFAGELNHRRRRRCHLTRLDE
ncbi:hypothetical protein D3C86_1821500 [compost metagenome]